MANDLVSIIMLSRNDVAYVEENGYAFSYTKYGIMDQESQDRGVVVGGKAHVNYKEMRKCCWPCYLTLPDG